MKVISDTSPINYLLLINQVDILPKLFEEIIIPDAVKDEMLDINSPAQVQQWIRNPPNWLIIQSILELDTTLPELGRGEQSAISLVKTISADLLIIDERLGRRAANERGIATVGTIGVLDDASKQGFINLEESIAQLQKTNFRISHRIIQTLLKNN